MNYIVYSKKNPDTEYTWVFWRSYAYEEFCNKIAPVVLILVKRHNMDTEEIVNTATVIYSLFRGSKQRTITLLYEVNWYLLIQHI